MKKNHLRYAPLFIVCLLISAALCGLMIYQHQLSAREKSDVRLNTLYEYIDNVFKNRTESAEAKVKKRSALLQSSLETAAMALRDAGITSPATLDPNAPAMTVFDCIVDPTYYCFSLITDEKGKVLYTVTPNENMCSSEEIDAIFKGVTALEGTWEQLKKGTGLDENWNTIDPISYRDDNDMLWNVYCEPVSPSESGNSPLYLVYIENPQITLYASNFAYLSVDFVNQLDDGILFLCVYPSGKSIFNTTPFETINAGELGFTDQMLEDGYQGSLKINGTQYLVDTRSITYELIESTLSVVALRNTASFIKINYVIWDILLFFGLSLIFLIYAISFREYSKETGGLYSASKGRHRRTLHYRFNGLIAKKLAPIGIICILLVFLFSFISTTLCCISDTMVTMVNRQQETVNGLSSAYTMQEASQNFKEYMLTEQMKVFSAYIRQDPGNILSVSDSSGSIPYYTLDKDGTAVPVQDRYGSPVCCMVSCNKLVDIATALSFTSAKIYNIDGYAIATTDDSHPLQVAADDSLRDVVLWRTDYYCSSSDENKIDTCASHFMLYSDTDPDGNKTYITREEYESRKQEGATGLHEEPLTLCVTIYQDLTTTQSSMSVLAYMLDEMALNDTNYMFFSDDENKTVLYVPEFLEGQTFKSMNLPASLLENSTFYMARLGNSRYLLYSNKISFKNTDSYYWLVSMVKTEKIFSIRMDSVLPTGISMVAFILLLSLIFCMNNKEEQPEQDDTQLRDVTEEPEKASFVYSISRKRMPKWKDNTPDQKFSILLGFFISLVSVLLLAQFLFSSNSSDMTLLKYLGKLNWIRGINVFSFTAAGLLTLWLRLLEIIMLRIMEFSQAMANDRTETFIRLAASILKYVIILCIVFFGLYLFGLNTISVLTSLGAFSLIVGLGANKLFGDVIAGIFIIIEGEFQVGDIVTIGNFCGKVTDIGVRTTKLENLDGNVNILTNSSIISVLNMSHRSSRVKIDLSIKKDVPIQRVEEILEQGLVDISKNCGIKHSMIQYKGVNQISGLNNVYRIEAGCSEYLRNPLLRYLNRELILLFKQNDILIS